MLKFNRVHFLIALLSITGLCTLAVVTCFAQNEIKQLKKPNHSKIQVKADTMSTDATEGEAGTSTSDTSDQTALPQIPLLGQPYGKSRSVVTERHIDADGNVIQKRKVIENGVVVQDEEQKLEPDENGNIPMMDDDMGGMLLRSEQIEDFPFMMNGNPQQIIQQIGEQIRRQQERQKQQFEALRQGNFGRNFPSYAPLTTQPVSEYWIGASVQPVPEFLSEHLNLENGTGVLILTVCPDSPAQKAGLKKNDIITSIGEETIKDSFDIGKIVDRDKDKKQTLNIIRHGSPEKIELTPEKRPADSLWQIPEIEADNQDFDQSIRVVRPGMIIPSLENANSEDTENTTQKADSNTGAPDENKQEENTTPNPVE